MSSAATDNTGGRFLDEDQSLACIHCGLCLSSCPTYLETGNENDSPRGRIYLMRAVQSGRLDLEESVVRHFDLCLGCRACEAACPSGVEYGALLETTREHVEKTYRRKPTDSFVRRWMIEKIIPYPNRARLAMLPARVARRLKFDRWLPSLARRFTDLLPEQGGGYRELPEFSPATTEKRLGLAGLVRGCVGNLVFNRTNWSTLKLLNAAGYDVTVPRKQVCCGALHAHSGQLAQARDFARNNIEIFQRQKPDVIVINAAGCGSTLKEYGHLLYGDSKWSGAGDAFSMRVRDLSEVLVDSEIFMKQLRSAPPLEEPGHRVTYHDACHLAHAQRITSPPRRLLQSVPGIELLELHESDVCCGSAGSYNLTEPAMAERLQRRKIRNVRSSEATVLITSNPGCLLQIHSGLKREGLDQIRAVQLADFLAERLDFNCHNR